MNESKKLSQTEKENVVYNIKRLKPKDMSLEEISRYVKGDTQINWLSRLTDKDRNLYKDQVELIAKKIGVDEAVLYLSKEEFIREESLNGFKKNVLLGTNVRTIKSFFALGFMFYVIGTYKDPIVVVLAALISVCVLDILGWAKPWGQCQKLREYIGRIAINFFKVMAVFTVLIYPFI